MVKLGEMVKQRSERRALAEALERLESLLVEIPFVRLKGSKTDVRFSETQVDLVSGKPDKFVAEVKTQGEPRLIRVAVEQLKRYLQRAQDTYGIIVAPLPERCQQTNMQRSRHWLR
jgi:transposase